MADSTETVSCLIIGAGLSGLVAAAALQKAGIRPTVVERENYVGGRMASWQLLGDAGPEPPAVFDTGAQFFTVRQPLFAGMVSDWRARGLVVEWSRGFAAGDGSYYADGHPRYRGAPTMAAIANFLGRDLDLRLSTPIAAVEIVDNSWKALAEDGSAFRAQSLIITAPVPIALDLLPRMDAILPGPTRKVLQKIDYDPCIAVMVLLDEPGSLPAPGGMWPYSESIDWLADNHQKGISPRRGAFTLHASPDFSRQHWLSDDAAISDLLLSAAQPWLGSAIKEVSVRRWRFSKPQWTFPDPCMAFPEPAPIILAGDAFAGPRIEGAALSGLAAANWLRQHFRDPSWRAE